MDSYEQWRDIPGFSLYEVSDQGRVRTKATGKIRTGSLNRYSHRMRVQMVSDDGTAKSRYIHRLVAEAFLWTFDKSFDVGFRDGDITNYKATNLVMLTVSHGIKQ